MIVRNGKPTKTKSTKPLIPKNKKTLTKESFDPLRIDCPPTDNIAYARFAMVGEAPSNVEVLEGQPFVGPSGAQLNRIIAAAQLPRYEIYLTNACKTQLPKNNSDVLWTSKGYRHPKWGELQKALIEELSHFKGKFIMLLGSTAMRLLIDNPRFDSIMKFRGSQYKAEEFPHLRKKLAGKVIILSYHPSYTLPYKDPKSFYVMIMDVNKMMRLDNDPGLMECYPKIITHPSYEKTIEFLTRVKQATETAFDIEATPKFVTCFSFAIRDNKNHIEAMSIPLMDNSGNYWTTEQETEIWRMTAEILNDPNIKIIAQNGIFDLMFILRTLNIKSDNFHFDTMLAQHLVYTELPKGLDFLTSVYTYFPYHKDEGKESHLAMIKDWPAYWKYNAKDSAYLFPIMDQLKIELEDFEATDAMQYQMDLHKPIMEMEYNGLLVDKEGIEEYRKELTKKIEELQKKLNDLIGKELNVNSSSQLISYFYGECKIKPYMAKRKKANGQIESTPTCNTVALHRIAKKKEKKFKQAAEVAKIIIDMRKYGKLITTYFKTDNIDEKDNKLRCSYKIAGTVSGRLASSKTFFEHKSGEKLGANLQNQPYAYKKYIMADPGKIFVECDLAKAEAHVVAYLCQDENMIEAFESGVDVHSFNASKIFDVPIEDVIEEHHKGNPDGKTMRDMGKRVVHACCPGETEVLTYDGWIKLSDVSPYDSIAVWSKETNQITFEEPEKWHSYDYQGDLLHFQGRTIDQIVTPNHKIVHYMSKDHYYKKEYALEVMDRKRLRIPVNGYYKGSMYYDEALIQLAVAIQADGSYKRQTRIRFHLKRYDKVKRLTKILTDLNIKFTHTKQKNDGSDYISFPRSYETDMFLTNKQFNWNLLSLHSDEMDLFLAELFHWDGGKYKTKTGEFKRYNSKGKQNCIIVSTIAHLRNQQGILREVKPNFYSVTFNDTKNVGSKFVKLVPYNGKVYCPTVSTGCFLIRQNDMISITSNSNYNMGPQTFSDNLATENTFMSQSECKILLQNYQDRFPGLKRWHKEIETEVRKTRVLYNLFNRPRRFLGMMNAALYRNAYSYKPQSTVAELLNKGMIKMSNDQRLGPDLYDIDQLVTVHDSTGWQFDISQAKNLLNILLIIDDHMRHTFTLFGRSFTIGLDATIGFRWKGKNTEIARFDQDSVDKALGIIGV